MSNKSNSQIVRELVRKEVIDSLEDHISNATTEKELLQDFYKQIESSSKNILKVEVTIHEVIDHLLSGCYGGFEFTNEGVQNFIDKLNLNNKSNKKFSYEDNYRMYKRLVTRETLYLFRKNDIEYKLIFYRW